MMVRQRGRPEFPFHNTPDTGLLHQSGNSGPGNGELSIQKFFSYPRAPVSGPAFLIHLPYFFCELNISSASGRRHCFQPAVKTASAYFENTAHLLNSKYIPVSFYEPEYLLPPLEKMPTAFFRISRSVCTSCSSFFKRWISSCSGVRIVFPLPEKLVSAEAVNSLRHR